MQEYEPQIQKKKKKKKKTGFQMLKNKWYLNVC